MPITHCLSDEEKPNLQCPHDMDISLPRGQSSGMLQYDVPKATDNVDSNLRVTCEPKPGSLLQTEITTITCRASDKAGNDAECIFRAKRKEVLPVGEHTHPFLFSLTLSIKIDQW